MTEVDIPRYELLGLVKIEARRLMKSKEKRAHPSKLLREIYDNDPMIIETAGSPFDEQGAFVKTYIADHRITCGKCRVPKSNGHLSY